LLDKILKPIVIWTTGTIGALGYFGIVLMMAIESACIPLPSEIIMPFGGYLAQAHPDKYSILGMGIAGGIGCVVGSWLAYWVGYFGGRPLVEKYGKYILLKKRDLNAADRFFAKYGDWAIFISRLLPVVRTFISLPAGISRMPFWRFTIYTFLGSVPWCYMLAWAGWKLGSKWSELKKYFHQADAVIVALIVIGMAFWLWHHLRPDSEEEAAS
jgi:membrane protein DedA with SNARE-associated domain